MPLTISDVAKAAGVSAATVDRALNGRGGVHARTRGRVLRAAQRLGYIDPAMTPHAAPIRLAFVIPGGTTAFLATLAARLAACARPGIDIAVHRLDTYRPQALADDLRRVAAGCEAVGVVALDHPAVREAIRDLVRGGTRVLTLVSDISDVPRVAYVGIDNRAAGRLAAHLLGRFLPGGGGEVALFAGSLSYRGHEEREMGFRRLCAEDFDRVTLLPTVEVEDDAGQAYGATRALLARHPALAGIYCIGGGVRGVVQALSERAGCPRIVCIGHELTEHTRRSLVDGLLDAVIDQDPAAEATRAVGLLAAAVRGQALPPVPPLRTQAIFRENIPDLAIPDLAIPDLAIPDLAVADSGASSNGSHHFDEDD